jgi:hypothetical protein
MSILFQLIFCGLGCMFHFANLPYWIFLGMGVLLFLLVIVSGGGDDDLDLDADADMDNPFDLDTDSDSDFSVSQLMAWLSFGRAPLILLLATDLSLWGVFGWMLNVVVWSTIGQFPGSLLAGVILVVSLGVALFCGSLVARPVGKVFASFGEDTSRDRLIGCTGSVGSAVIPSAQDGRIGQVDVLDSARNRVTINAQMPEWATVMPRFGDQVLVIDRSAQTYLVVIKDSPDQDQWMDTSRKQDLH